MQSEPGLSPATEPKEHSSRVPRWLVVLTALALSGVVGVIVYGYLTAPGWVGVAHKKFWDYLELLIVPTALAIGVYWLNRAQNEREREAEEAQKQREREAEEARREREHEAAAAQRERELEVENQRAQDEALQAYLDQTSRLMLDKDRPLRRDEQGDEVQTLARARTSTALIRLDASRKRSVLQFLYESDLVKKGHVVVDLRGADLSAAGLSGADLSDANVSETNVSLTPA
jgi:hypothetical protein